MMDVAEQTKKAGLTPKDKAVHIELARAFYFFERANPPEEIDPEGKWPDARETYLRRSRRLMQALRKAGLVVARVPEGTADDE